ncbi:MAG: hypothetical protein WA137_07540 [Methanothrix sp.]
MKARAGATGSLHDDSRFRQCYRQWHDRAGTNFDYYHLPYVAMTCDTVPHAENFLINSTRMFGLNHLLLDVGGNATVL